jgi:anti-sigma B factor antagonist
MSREGFFSSQLADDQTQILMLDGEFDLTTAPKLEQAIDDALDSGRRNLVVDLRGVSFLDGTMLHALVRGWALLLGHDRRFALIRPNPLVWRTFVLTGLSRALPTFGGVAEAVSSFRAEGAR